MTANTSAPHMSRGDTLAEKISDGFRIDITSSIRCFDVSAFLIDTVNISKNPVEKTNEIKPIKTTRPPTIKDELIYECKENSL